MIVASHQIDLLPYPGFFNRMMAADIFDLGGHYDPWRKGKGIYQHRVMLGFDDTPVWLTLPVIASQGMTQDEVMLHTDRMGAAFDKVYGVYRPCRNFRRYSDHLEHLFKYPPPYLWQFNLNLLLWLRDELGITTPLSISRPPAFEDSNPTKKIVRQLKSYQQPGQTLCYYSGAGGRDYLDLSLMEEAGIVVMFQDYSQLPIPEGFRTVSILSMLMCMEKHDIIRSISHFMF